MTPTILTRVMVSLAQAEEKADLGANQRLRTDTSVSVEIVDPATERIRYLGEIVDPDDLSVQSSDVTVFLPSGAPLGTFPSGSLVVPGVEVGAYRLEFADVDLGGDPEFEPLEEWAITVVRSGVDVPGRVWSRRWRIDSGSFQASSATDGSFFTVVPGGTPADEGVVELKAEGLAGFLYTLIASQEGITDGNGRSRPLNTPDNWSSVGENQIFLAPPDPAVVNYTVLTPQISAASLEAEGTCGVVAPGLPGAEAVISFDSSVTGVAHIVCDLDADGVYNLADDGDFHLLVEARQGANSFRWSGQDNTGQVVPIGSYDCQILLTVGEFHFVANDIETSYPGFRLFQVSAAGVRTGLPMYWNDAEVQGADVQMPNGQVGLERSGPAGLPSGAPGDATLPNVNARSWGNFTSTSKGDTALLDTYTWLAQDVDGPFPVEIADTTIDTDLDGLVDAEESCVTGTSPALADTDADGLGDLLEVQAGITDPIDGDSDGDGLLDGEEASALPFPDTDEDGDADPVDPDDDGDGVPTVIEGQGDPDGDSLPAHLDDDDDGDGVPTEEEDVDGDGNVRNDDSDGDGTADWLDDDDDGDGVDDEDVDADGDPTNDDTDEDGVPDYRDADDDEDGIDTADEWDLDEDGVADDHDEDGIPNLRDPDDDEDGVPTSRESLVDTDLDGFPDFVDDDADDDGVLDGADGLGDIDGDDLDGFQDPDDDGDGVDTIDEVDALCEDPEDGIPAFQDTDDDGDGVLTADELDVDGDGAPDDYDGDLLPNHLDCDDDGDGIPTSLEGDGDSDRDGIPDFLDPDSDNDTIFDSEERTDDTDDDFTPDFQDRDDDGDGIDTLIELGDAAGQPGSLTDDADTDRAPNSDGDRIPDWQDPDDDDDGIPTEVEGGPGDDADGDDLPNYLDLDSDEDGIEDEDEGALDVDGDDLGNFVDPDADGDGYADDLESTVDTDLDTTPDYLDADDDDDTVPSLEERKGDTDGDGAPDRIDADDDGDGILTATEVADALLHEADPDGDGDPPWVDTDSDGDEVLDADEPGDADGDAIPDYLDPDGIRKSYFRGSGLLACASTGSPSAASAWALGLLGLALARRRRP